MNDLSITQSYLLCAVNDKGLLPGMRPERGACFLAAGLLELRLAGCLTLEKRKVSLCAPLPEKCSPAQAGSRSQTGEVRGRRLELGSLFFASCLLPSYHAYIPISWSYLDGGWVTLWLNFRKIPGGVIAL